MAEAGTTPGWEPRLWRASCALGGFVDTNRIPIQGRGKRELLPRPNDHCRSSVLSKAEITRSAPNNTKTGLRGDGDLAADLSWRPQFAGPPHIVCIRHAPPSVQSRKQAPFLNGGWSPMGSQPVAARRRSPEAHVGFSRGGHATRMVSRGKDRIGGLPKRVVVSLQELG